MFTVNSRNTTVAVSGQLVSMSKDKLKAQVRVPKYGVTRHIHRDSTHPKAKWWGQIPTQNHRAPWFSKELNAPVMGSLDLVEYVIATVRA